MNTEPQRFLVPDLLTLMAVSSVYPRAFVAPGATSKQFYCLRILMASDSAMDNFETSRRIQTWSTKRKQYEDVILPIILYPTWRDADLMVNESGNVKCYACGRLLTQHGEDDGRPDDRPDGLVPPQLQERNGQGPSRQRGRKAYR
jgi:hypothetical protein